MLSKFKFIIYNYSQLFYFIILFQKFVVQKYIYFLSFRFLLDTNMAVDLTSLIQSSSFSPML
jgi:hypothetical protein